MKFSSVDSKLLKFNTLKDTLVGSRNYRCLECNKILGFSNATSHIKESHNLTDKEYIVKYFYNNNTPKCILEGCDNDVIMRNTFSSGDYGGAGCC